MNKSRFEKVKISVEKTLNSKLTAKEFSVTPTRINQILREGGTNIKEIRKAYFEKTFSEKFIELTSQLKRIPTEKETKALYSSQILSKTFRESMKSHRKVAKASGLKYWKRKGTTREELLKDIIELAKTLGSTPSIANISLTGHSHMKYIRMFGSIQNAQKEAGLLPNLQGKKPNTY